MTYEPFGRRKASQDEYYSAAVCPRGHVADSALDLRQSPLDPHCGTCGKEVLLACPSCGNRIRGAYVGVVAPYEPREFCTHCGEPFPWASQQALVFAIENKLDDDADLTEADKRILRKRLEELQELPMDRSKEKTHVEVLNFFRERAPQAFQMAMPYVMPLATAWMRKEMGLPPT